MGTSTKTDRHLPTFGGCVFLGSSIFAGLLSCFVCFFLIGVCLLCVSLWQFTNYLAGKVSTSPETGGHLFLFLWRGRCPYNCVSSENLRTKQKWTRMARKNGKSVQTKNKTHQKPKRPANPPARFAFRHKTTQRNNTETGQGPTKTPNLDLPCDTETIQQYHF